MGFYYYQPKRFKILRIYKYIVYEIFSQYLSAFFNQHLVKATKNYLNFEIKSVL
jgi:hypothetical protein